MEFCQGPTVCVLTSSPGDSDASQHLKPWKALLTVSQIGLGKINGLSLKKNQLNWFKYVYYNVTDSNFEVELKVHNWSNIIVEYYIGPNKAYVSLLF